MNETQSYAPHEFLESLKKNEISIEKNEISNAIILQGMVKPDEGDDQYLLFAQGSVCAEWVRIPLAAIESIEFLKFVPCKDHQHPLVLLHARQPVTDEGRMFASLLQAISNRMKTVLTAGNQVRVLSGPRSFGERQTFLAGQQFTNRQQAPQRFFNDAGVGPEPPEFAWCNSLPAVAFLSSDGAAWCLDWCWESEHRAMYKEC